MWFTLTATYDNTGFVDYLDTFNDASDQFDDFTVLAGARMEQNLVDMSARSGFAMIGAKPKTTHQSACEYYNLDWENGEVSCPLIKTARFDDIHRLTAESPEESSWIAASWVLLPIVCLFL